MKNPYETPEIADRIIVQNISQKHIIILCAKFLVTILLGNISERRIDEKYQKLDKIFLNDRWVNDIRNEIIIKVKIMFSQTLRSKLRK